MEANEVSYQQLCYTAQVLIQQNNFTEAKKILIAALHHYPNEVHAWTTLADIHLREKDTEKALIYLKRVTELLPNDVTIMNSFAANSFTAGKFKQGVEAFKRVEQLTKNNHLSMRCIAYGYRNLGDLKSSIEYFKKSLNTAKEVFFSTHPKTKENNIKFELEYHGYYYDLIATLALTSQSHEIIQYCEEGLKMVDPDQNAIALFSLSVASSLKSLDLLSSMPIKAQTVSTSSSVVIDKIVYFKQNLGHAYNMTGRPQLATEILTEILPFKSNDADIHFELGKSYAALSNTTDAEYHLMRANELQGISETYYALAILHRKMHKFRSASEEFFKACELNPKNGKWFGDYMYSLKSICLWEKFEELKPVLIDRMEEELKKNNEAIVHPFSAIMYNFNVQQIFRLSKAMVAIMEDNVVPFVHERSSGVNAQKRKLRIGYVSSNFLNHAQGNQLANYFKNHDREQFEVYAYNLQIAGSIGAKIQQDNIKGQVDQFISLVELNEQKAAQKIRDDKIDILIDCCGHVDENRIAIFAYRPAPIQIEWLGYPSTSAAKFIDYYVGDKYSTPEELWPYFSEKIITMPHTYQVTEHKNHYPNIYSAKQMTEFEELLKIKEKEILGDGAELLTKKASLADKFVFCNFNQAVKIDAKTFEVWMKILQRVPNSIFWLVNLADDAIPVLKSHAEKHSIDPNRLIFAPSTAKLMHILRMKKFADLLLDTPVYNAHTSAGDALWAGVPIITLQGQNLASRVCASMLHAANCPETIVNTYREYEDLAVELATNRSKFEELRDRLITSVKVSPLFDTQQYVKDFEKALKHAWMRHCEGQSPDHIDVSAL